MKLRWALYLVILAPIAAASTIDVSAETSAVMHTGDTLVFHLFTGNFAANAAANQLPLNATEVNFTLVSVPLSGAGKFTAALQSADREMSEAFGNVSFLPGNFQGSGYAGTVSTLQGYLHVSAELSQALSGDSSALIVLRNEGPDVTVGLPGYALRQDMYASLSGGPLSVGALPGMVDLESPVNRASSMDLMNLGEGMDLEGGPAVPEPGSGVLLLGGGVLLCGLSVVLARFRVRA